MEGAGMRFVAVRDIPVPGDDVNGVYAFRAGDVVHESNVGEGGWLRLGVDVAARPGADVPPPKLTAPQHEWAAWAVTQGGDADKLAAMSRSQIIREYAPKAPADG